VHEPLPMIPLVRKGNGKGGDKGGVDWVRKKYMQIYRIPFKNTAIFIAMLPAAPPSIT